MCKLLIATNNRGKLLEYLELLKGVPFELTWPEKEGITLEVEESASSYHENASLKALTWAKVTGFMAMADDSGLEVDALGGAPGPLSARYGGLKSDREKYELLLREIANVPWEKRTARFRCVIALAFPDGRLYTFEGIKEGYIALKPEGEHGFGYDPIFFIPELGKTMAQLPLEEKNRISHRAQAARQLRDFLNSLSP
ncbi:MAG: RdgB/HAM1 family non-canonical purine NTP pyrophosphatase [Anaerolineae bacterium]|nr:RdgB/HAM1 family non-canonical purine NTP pyrophosphatase [Anaerolineae bacterium]MDW8102413.1 RdgB/HAM1 family non-canonical purine NTP pyrophosphatase [Anaerolineae bacterium]